MKSKNIENKKLFFNDLNPENIIKYLPKFKKHIHENIVIVDDKMLTGLKIYGKEYKSVDDEILINSFSSVARFFTFIGKDFGSRLFIWATISKKKETLLGNYHSDNIFIQRFTEDYIKNINSVNFFKTEYYLTIALKITNLEDTQKDILALISQIEALLNSYECLTLGIINHKNKNSATSSLMGFIASLINYDYSDIPVTSDNFSDYIFESDIYANYDFINIRNKRTSNQKYATCYDLKGFPVETVPAMWDFILKQPFEFTLTQSLVYIPMQTSEKKLSTQINKLKSVDDPSLEYSDELISGLAQLQEGYLCFVDFHSSLVIFGDTPKEAIDNSNKCISDYISEGGGIKWEKATYSSFNSYFSHIPLCKFRPLHSIRTSINFCCLFSLHNNYQGKAKGNPIGNGDAVIPLKTDTNSLYYYNSHYSKLYENSIGKKVAGHTVLLGATGFGKTTLEATIIAFLQRFNIKMFVIDYKRSTELYVRAYGGEYFTLQDGVDTGLNPFQLEEFASPKLRLFLSNFVYSCAKDETGNLSDMDKKVLDRAIDSVLDVPLLERRFGLLLQAIPDGDLHIRLEKWCINLVGAKGVFAWAVDSPINKFNPLLFNKIGFDTTDILKMDNEVTEAVLGILLFYKELMQKDGDVLLTVIEEFHKPCNYPLTAKPIETSLKVGRLQGEFVYLISQSPADALNCSINVAVKEQTQTKIFLGNPYGSWEDYQKIGLTKKEYNIVKNFTEVERLFLIKQGSGSTVAKLDLSNCLQYLPIISSSTENIVKYEQLIKEIGHAKPNEWTMQFLKIINKNESIEYEKEI